MTGTKMKKHAAVFSGRKERTQFILMVIAIAIIVTYTAVREKKHLVRALNIMNDETVTTYSISDRSSGKIRMLVTADSVVAESGSGYQKVEGTSLTWPTTGQQVKAVSSGNTVRLISYDDLCGIPIRRRDCIRNARITVYTKK